MKISVTHLSAYLYCKRKLYLEQVLGLRELVPKEILVTGKIKHDALDFANKQEMGIILGINKENEKDIEQIYRNSYSRNLTNSLKMNSSELKKINKEFIEIYTKLWPSMEKEAEFRSNIVKKFVQEHNVYGEELWNKLEPKIVTEIYVDSEKLELKGKIDRMEVFIDKVIPIELKTGSAPKQGVWESHLIQIAAYVMLLEEKYSKENKEIPKGIVDYITEKEIREVMMNPFLRDEVINLKNKVKALLESKELPDFVDNKKKCESCGLRKECYNM